MLQGGTYKPHGPKLLCPGDQQAQTLEKNTWVSSTQTSPKAVRGMREEAARYKPDALRSLSHPGPRVPGARPGRYPSRSSTVASGPGMGFAGGGPALGTGEGRTEGRREGRRQG